MKQWRVVLALAVLLAGVGWGARDWLGIPDIPADTLRARYGEGSRYVELLGASVRVKESGQGEPLLLLHGFAASADTWDGWRRELEGQYRVIAVDVPPFGLTGPMASRPVQAADLQSFMDALVPALGLDAEPFHLAGNSLGGYISWNFARRHPEKLRSLTLVDSAGYPLPPPLPVKLMKWPVTRVIAAHLSPYPVVAASVRDVYGEPANVTDAQIQRYADMMRREDSRPAVSELMRSLAFDGVGISDVRVPTLILWGAKDRWIPVEHAPRYQHAISGSQLIVYDTLGHIPMEEDPPRTAADLRRFLQSLSLQAQPSPALLSQDSVSPLMPSPSLQSPPTPPQAAIEKNNP